MEEDSGQRWRNKSKPKQIWVQYNRKNGRNKAGKGKPNQISIQPEIAAAMQEGNSNQKRNGVRSGRAARGRLAACRRSAGTRTGHKRERTLDGRRGRINNSDQTSSTSIRMKFRSNLVLFINTKRSSDSFYYRSEWIIQYCSRLKVQNNFFKD